MAWGGPNERRHRSGIRAGAERGWRGSQPEGSRRDPYRADRGPRRNADDDDVFDPRRARGARALPEGRRDPRDDPRPARGAELAPGVEGGPDAAGAHRARQKAHEILNTDLVDDLLAP